MDELGKYDRVISHISGFKKPTITSMESVRWGPIVTYVKDLKVLVDFSYLL